MFIPISKDERILLPKKDGAKGLWNDAVKHGETHAHVSLPSLLKEYLVLTLVEHINETHFMDRTIAIDLLEGTEKNDLAMIARAASTSLLILGLFPE